MNTSIVSNYEELHQGGTKIAFEFFKNRFSIFEDNQINNVITLKVKPFLDALEDESSYNLFKFLDKIAHYDALKESSRLFSLNYELYKLMYLLNDFRKFELRAYPGSLNNHQIFTKLFDKVYPQKKSKKHFHKNPETIDDEFLNVKQVAELTNYAVATIYDLKHKGKIPFYKNGAKLQFKKSEILLWMEKGKGTTKDDLERKANEYIIKNS